MSTQNPLTGVGGNAEMISLHYSLPKNTSHRRVAHNFLFCLSVFQCQCHSVSHPAAWRDFNLYFLRSPARIRGSRKKQPGKSLDLTQFNFIFKLYCKGQLLFPVRLVLAYADARCVLEPAASPYFDPTQLWPEWGCRAQLMTSIYHNSTKTYRGQL